MIRIKYRDFSNNTFYKEYNNPPYQYVEIFYPFTKNTIVTKFLLKDFDTCNMHRIINPDERLIRSKCDSDILSKCWNAWFYLEK